MKQMHHRVKLFGHISEETQRGGNHPTVKDFSVSKAVHFRCSGKSYYWVMGFIRVSRYQFEKGDSAQNIGRRVLKWDKILFSGKMDILH